MLHAPIVAQKCCYACLWCPKMQLHASMMKPMHCMHLWCPPKCYYTHLLCPKIATTCAYDYQNDACTYCWSKMMLISITHPTLLQAMSWKNLHSHYAPQKYSYTGKQCFNLLQHAPMTPPKYCMHVWCPKTPHSPRWWKNSRHLCHAPKNVPCTWNVTTCTRVKTMPHTMTISMTPANAV